MKKNSKTDSQVRSMTPEEHKELLVANQRVSQKQAELGKLRKDYLAQEARLSAEIDKLNELGVMRLKQICAAHHADGNDGRSWTVNLEKGTITLVPGLAVQNGKTLS